MYKKIASNTIFQIISKVLTALISIFLIGILTKWLPIELYGTYNKVFSYLGIFAFLADLWLYTITVREISNGKVSAEKIIWNVLSLRILLAVIIWVFACSLAFFLPGYGDIYTFSAIVIVWFFTLVSLINSSLLALMQSQMKMEFSLFSLVAWKLLNILLVGVSILHVFTKQDDLYSAFISVFIAASIGISLTTWMNYIYAKKICPISLRCDREYILYIFKISLPYWVALFLSVVYFKIDIILLSFLESPDMSNTSIALYGLPMKIVEVLMVLWGFYLNSLLPTLSKRYKDSGYEHMGHLLWISLKVLISFWLLVLVLINLFWTALISVIATPEYLSPLNGDYSSVQAFSVVSWVLLLHFISLWFIYVFIAAEKQSVLLKINILVTLVNIVWNILFIPYFSFIWAAMTTLLSQWLLMVISWTMVLGRVKVHKNYYNHVLRSCVLALGIFILFQQIMSVTNFSYIPTLLFLWPACVAVYLMWEYMLSRKLIKMALSE